MKKEERLHRLFGDIDEELVADAARQPRSLRVWLLRLTPVAAAVALTVGLVLAPPWGSTPPPVIDGSTPENNTTTNMSAQDTSLPTTTAPPNEMGSEPTHVAPPPPVGGTPTTAVAGVEIWKEPPWDERPLTAKFISFERDGMEHTVRCDAVDAAQVGEYLTDVPMRGYDGYTETAHTTVGHLYRLKGINDACAVALQYDGDTAFYPAVNRKYVPATLGELIIDLNLRENIHIGTVYSTTRDADGRLHDFEYSGLTVDAVWSLLMADPSLPNVWDEQAEWSCIAAVRIDVPVLGYFNISITVMEEGYLFTNLLDTGKAFFIGEEKTAAFMDYVRANCTNVIDKVQQALSGDTTHPNAVSSAAQGLVTATTKYRK